MAHEMALPQVTGISRKTAVRTITPTPGARITRVGGNVKFQQERVRDAVMRAFDKLGGEEYLVVVGRRDPKTFLAFLARCMPQEMKAELSGNVAHKVVIESGIGRNPTDVIDTTATEIV